MRRLIINAGDLGANPSRSHGIFETFERGVLTSASLLVNLSDSQRAAELARRAELPTGLHLNFTEGFPMSPPENIGTLLSADGMFLDRKRMLRALDDGIIDPRHIEWEFRAQMEFLIDHRKEVTHVDSHHNVHVHPNVVTVLAPLIAQYGVRWTRITDEEEPPPYRDLTEDQRTSIARMTAQAKAAQPLYEAHGVGSTDHFLGLALSGNASKKAFRQLLKTLPEGTTELMVHPGQCTVHTDPFSDDSQRETEREMLVDEGIAEYIEHQKIELISFQDL